MNPETSLFHTVLVANRGEIAVRVLRTLRRLGITGVAVYSDADADARHVHEADVAVRIGPAAPAESYLNIPAVIEAARATGAQAIHPGYGFLSENAAFAAACAEAGIVFIGPPTEAVQVMGDKIRAKNAVRAAGVPVVPGRSDPDMTDADLIAAAEEIGYPVLVKPSAGGGGKGMHRVADPAQLPAALVAARREAKGAFGDDTLFLERFVDTPRHIEVQVMADTFGHTIHLGERECSLQRRHQKVIEEAPSVLLDEATRQRIGAAAVATAAAVGYTGAGTVEFLVGADRPDEFFFLEMNTRLQVEHPVTELVTGLDLVEWQIRVAAGQPLALTQSDVRLSGHAIEARVYAEHPAAGFLPAAGEVLALTEPAGPGVRIDSSLRVGDVVGTHYDPLLAKVITWGPDRATALRRLDDALDGTVVLGLETNVGFLRTLIAHPAVAAGDLDTGLIDREAAELVAFELPDVLPAAVLLRRVLDLAAAAGDDIWSRPTGWRGRRTAALSVLLRTAPGAAPLQVSLIPLGDPATAGAAVRVGEREHRYTARAVPGGVQIREVGPDAPGRAVTVHLATDGDRTFAGCGGSTAVFTEVIPRLRGGVIGAGDGQVRSPMPGTVIAVPARVGDIVGAGTTLVVVEAMKMEHSVRATIDGVVTAVPVEIGAQVRVDELLATVDPRSPDENQHTDKEVAP